MKKLLYFILGALVIISFILINNKNNSNTIGGSCNIEDECDESEIININSETLYKMLKSKDFVMIDVHIPEQKHIPQTDLIIPYNNIDAIKKQIPKNKNTKIVLYCRSGSMSKQTAKRLKTQGYTKVYDLIGGKNTYDEYLKQK